MKRRCLIWALALLAAASTAVAVAQMSDNTDLEARDIAQLQRVLGVAPGMVLADIGAGEDAPMALPMVRAVAPGGRVYATEVDDGTLDKLRAAVAKADRADAIVIVKAGVNDTGLPDACCDGLYLRRVYHHFGDPAAINASMLAALKPGGRLAVIDFPDDDGHEVAKPGERAGKSHGVRSTTVVRELRAAGFEVISTDRREDDSFLVLAKRPL